MQLPKFGKLGRYAVCILLVLVIFIAYEFRLLQWQLVDGEKYEQISLSNRTDSIELDAARGEILDLNGKVLAGNKTTYNIVYNALNMNDDERNVTIIKVVDLLESRDEKWRDRLPIVLDSEGNYQFAEDQEDDVATLKGPDILNLADYATADDCIAELAKKYDCGGLSKEDTRKVASVRYSMTRDGFSRTNPYVIAQDVSSETVGVFSEQEDELQGIEPRVAVTRYYGEDGGLAPHILGNIGAISGADYDAAVENGTAYDWDKNISGYKWTDTVGTEGLESAFETQLRGKRGRETILTDDMGSVQSTAVTITPEEGNTVHLTLDSDLQRVANISLKKNIAANTLAKDCTAGAVVVLDVDNFGVLASSSYPTFDRNLYRTDDAYYKQLDADKTKPFYNRALLGTYTPGSVFKPMVALAALQEQVIGAGTTLYNCDGWFQYADLKLKCTGMHGYANVYQALAGSCNAFFCQAGLNLTIKKMDAYAEYFGLGQKTGVELYEETGIMSSPQQYLNAHGVEWTDGLSAQTAIGQCDNTFTPIQLATYCATIANGGVRLQTHFLDKITDYTGKETVEQYQSKELYDAKLSGDVLGVVQEGMRQVAHSSDGTAYSVFGDYPIQIAAKTGTAETSSDEESEPNLTFIAYAPINDPKIAVAVVMEKGYKGAYAQNVAKDILDQYFGYFTWDEEGNRYDQEGNLVDDEGKILKTKEEVAQEKAAEEAAKKEQNGSSSTASSSSQDPVSSAPSREEGIPTAPFTGNSSGATSSGLGSSPASEAPSASSRKPNSPYYTESG